jgi:vacuolar protein sorting-associated protein 54
MPMNTPVERLFRRSGSRSRRGNYGPPSLSVIPSIYFEEDFHLENPRSFRIASERSDIIPSNLTIGKVSNENPTEPRKALATNAIL